MDPRLLEASLAREQYLKQCGELDPDLLAPLINPHFLGGPAWPSLRQGWRVVRQKSTTLIFSDGLSDPFEDISEPNVGFGLEVFAATDDPLTESLAKSWLFQMVYEVSQEAANHGGFRELIEELGILSMEIEPTEDLAPVTDSNGSVGVLLGIPGKGVPTDWEWADNEVIPISIKLLMPSELEYVLQDGRKARETLANWFTEDGTGFLSSLQRKPLI